MTLLTVFIPLLNFLLMVFFSGRRSNWRHLSLLVISNMLLLLFVLLVAFPAIARGESYSTNIGNWLLSGLFEVNWVFSIDALTYAMLIVVLTVSTLVHFYSTEYMSEDPHVARFISYLSLFTFFMLLLVTSNNFVGLFLGWEGVGLCSYLLISFWTTRVQANKAAIKAMVVNRVSDLFFTVGILAVFYTFQTVEFSVVFGLSPYLTNSSILLCGYVVSPLTLITFLLFLGAMGKSAQIGLHTWLPDAMEGPTPVSALIHAATMVTAGVFLVIRCSPLFECVPSILTFMVLVGGGTAFMAATAGLLQNDLKKVIAYSTCSQLGYMIFVCGLSGYTASLFHLSTHAFFKALLFLSAGAVIHSVASEQDMRKFGGLARLLPYTYAAFFVGSITLMGIPFLSGYYSKDFILELAAGNVAVTSDYAYTFGLISAFFTSFYSFRLLHLAFFGDSRTKRIPLERTHELGKRMAFALFVLSVGSVFLGITCRDAFIGPGTEFWNGTITTGASFAEAQIAGEFLSTGTKLVPLFSAVVATATVFYVYGQLVLTTTPYGLFSKCLGLYRFLSYKWGFDTINNQFINKPLLVGAYNITFSLIDKGLLEFIGPTGLSQKSIEVGRKLSAMQTGLAYDYAGFMLIALCLILTLSNFAEAPTAMTAAVFISSRRPVTTGTHPIWCALVSRQASVGGDIAVLSGVLVKYVLKPVGQVILHSDPKFVFIGAMAALICVRVYETGREAQELAAQQLAEQRWAAYRLAEQQSVDLRIAAEAAALRGRDSECCLCREKSELGARSENQDTTTSRYRDDPQTPRPVDDTYDYEAAVKELAEKQDAAVPHQLNLRTSIYRVLENFIDLNPDLICFTVVIVLFTSWVLSYLIYFGRKESIAQPRCLKLLVVLWTYPKINFNTLCFGGEESTTPPESSSCGKIQSTWSAHTARQADIRGILVDNFIIISPTIKVTLWLSDRCEIYRNGIKNSVQLSPTDYDLQASTAQVMESFLNLHAERMFFIVILLLSISWMLSCLFYFAHKESK